MKFTLTIELGKDAMLNAYHVGKMLEETVWSVNSVADHNGNILPGTTRIIFDNYNGSTVGEWTVE
jgi:hypothetical protein